MRTEENHIIQKVFVEVDTNTSAKAHDIQLNSQSFLEQHVFKYVEAYIARLEDNTRNWTIQLDKVELNLKFEESNLGTIELQESIEEQLDAIFDPILVDITEGKAEHSEEAHISPSLSEGSKTETAEREHISILSPKARQEKSVLYFIKTGRIPWWVSTHAEMRKILEDKELQKLIRTSDGNFMSAMLQLVKSPLIRRRLIRQFSVETLFELITQQMHIEKPDIEVLPSLVANSEFKTQLNEASPTKKMEWLQTILVSSFRLERYESIQMRWATILYANEELSDPRITQLVTKNHPDFVASLRKTRSAEHSKSETMDAISKQVQEPSLEEAFNDIIAENAGLVILNPFIKPFLRKLGLLEDDGSLKDPVLTAHIFHYLATGEEEDFEFALLFEAFLCGLPIHEPLPKSIPLTDEIKKECQSLLESVLVHWEALKSRSIPLLQNNFLQRPGKLKLNEESPRIIVERTGIDILLDKIPWSISILKLPWHKEMTYVEW
ncbi:MAG: contractile injection system tape measure protein [Fluviicola sp.]